MKVEPISVLSSLFFASAMAVSTPISAANYTDVYNFKGPPTDGTAVRTDFIYQNGLLYGASYYGGPGHCRSDGNGACGVIFSLDPKTGREIVLYSFTKERFGQCPDGHLFYSNGKLYGVTFFGGKSGLKDCGCGVVFGFDLKTSKMAIIYTFRGNTADGGFPSGPVVVLNGSLYGTTQADGTNCGSGPCNGTVYKIDLATSQETLIHSFKGGHDGSEPTDGAVPIGGLVYANGLLYGTTGQGGGTGCLGSIGCGTIFSVDPNSDALTILHNFDSADGFLPEAELTFANRIFYGTTAAGGVSAGCMEDDGCGTVFSFDPTSNVEKVIYNVGDKEPGDSLTTRVVYNKNKLYGTNNSSDGTGPASVFEISLANNSYRDLIEFAFNGQAYDLTPLNNKFYGTNFKYATQGFIFKVNP